ncbi:unnamed protein product [Leuciscus chuanchicus]
MCGDTKKDEVKKDEKQTSGNLADIATLTTLLEEHRAALSSEFKSAFSTLESRLDILHTTVNDHEHRLCSLEANADTSGLSVGALESKFAALTDEHAKLKAKVMDLEGRSRRNNIRIFGLPETIEGPRPTTFFSELLVEIFGASLFTSPPDLDRAHRALTAKPKSGERPRSVIIRFHKFQTKDLVICEARKLRGKLQYRGNPVFINEDYSPEVLEMRAEYRAVMKELYQLGLRPSLHFPSKLFITTSDGKKRRLSSVHEAGEFIKTHRRESTEAT